MQIEKCPKCGSQALISVLRMTQKTSGAMEKRWVIVCMDCRCDGPEAGTSGGAWRRWNQQANGMQRSSH